MPTPEKRSLYGVPDELVAVPSDLNAVVIKPPARQESENLVGVLWRDANVRRQMVDL
jgi:hypothetical protein